MAKNKIQDEQQVDSNPNDATNSKIDAIKELIFGNNIKEYEHEFNEIKNIIAHNKEEIERNLNEAKNEIFDAMEELREDLNRQLDELHLNMNNEIDRLQENKTDRSLLVKLFSDLSKEIDD